MHEKWILREFDDDGIGKFVLGMAGSDVRRWLH